MKRSNLMNDQDQIRAIKAIDLKRYSNISSKEKLVAYTIKQLDDQDIATTFNNICIAAFKYFPEAFCFSSEYPEYPHIEMLNRTLLHLRPKERDYATGSARTEYYLTPLGKQIAIQVEADLDITTDAPVRKIKIDIHKKSARNDYERLKSSEQFANYKSRGIIDIDMIWNYFQITPYTQIEKIKKTLNDIHKYCAEIEDRDCSEFIDQLNKLLR